jgi:hypothetical protein
MIAPARVRWGEHRGCRLAGGQEIRSNFIDRGRGGGPKFLNLDKPFVSFSLYRLPLRNVYLAGRLKVRPSNVCFAPRL